MLSRRFLRIKIMQVLYAYFKSDDPSLSLHEKELFHSIDKAYELYHYLMLIPGELVKMAEYRIEQGRNKKILTREDLNPNLKFVNNKIIKQLNQNPELNKYCLETGCSWSVNQSLIKKIFSDFINSQTYAEYMESGSGSYEEDRMLVNKLLLEFIPSIPDLESLLEEQSIYWNDEFDFTLSMISKTIKSFRPEINGGGPLIPLFKNDEDRDYVKTLFRKVIVNHKDYLKIIDEYTTNWELDRIAFMDILLMEMALAELFEFPSIPTKVTLNEYIEISKYYSTKKSNTFINGVLDKVIHKFKAENKILKTGRGLMGES